MVPRMSREINDITTTTRVRVRTHPQYELELNENVEEPWVCMGEEEEDGC